MVTGKPSNTTDFLPEQGLIMVVGNYGSGKTEVCVNLAIRLALRGFSVQIADLDIVNPYFRCREAKALMERHGIRVVVPPGDLSWADLPIIVPEIQGMLSPATPGFRLFDVGGEDVGARLLSSLAERLGDAPYSLWQVINARRPFTDTVEGCVGMMDAIQSAARLEVTGLVANTHLVHETTPEVILQGWDLARRVSERTGRELMFVTAMGALADAPELAKVDVPVVRLQRHLLPPWLQEKEPQINLPAARPVPIGRPPGAD